MTPFELGLVKHVALAPEPHLNARQLAVLVVVARAPVPSTVRGLSVSLSIPKPSITRIINDLSDLGFVRRSVDRKDRRSVLIEILKPGNQYLEKYVQ